MAVVPHFSWVAVKKCSARDTLVTELQQASKNLHEVKAKNAYLLAMLAIYIFFI